jgi:hypothetical protein
MLGWSPVDERDLVISHLDLGERWKRKGKEEENGEWFDAGGTAGPTM